MLTLEEILQWNILKKARVLVDDFDRSTVIENITIVEAPDIGKWINGNNILLTGLYSIHDDKSKVDEFIESLHSGKVRAVFVKVDRFVSRVPPSIVEACKNLKICLVEIPQYIRYIDIMYPVIASIFESKVVQLDYHKKTLGTLSGVALGNRGVENIALACASLVDNPAIIYDENMHCVHSTDERYAGIAHTTLLEEGSWEELDYAVWKTRFTGGKGSFRQVIFPIRIFGRTKMYLSVVEEQSSLNKMDFVALENVVMVLSFEVAKDFAEEERGIRFKQEIVEDIKQGRDLGGLRERLVSAGLRAGVKCNAFLVQMRADPSGDSAPGTSQYFAGHNATKVYDIFVSIKKNMQLRGFTSYSATTVTAFIEQPPGSQATREATLEKLSKAFLERVGGVFPGMPVHAGYTSSFLDIEHVPELYKDAQQALHVCNMVFGKNEACDYNKLGVYKLLCLARNRKELETCIPATILQIEAHQRESGLPLIDTLAAYFDYNCNIQKTSRALSIHYKTLYYRLNKVETIANISLKNSMELFELQLGLYLLRLLSGDTARIA